VIYQEVKMTQQVQPIFILPEGSQRTTGKTAQRNNIMAAKAVAETVRTTLGPKGMDKMLVDSIGDITVTNDGVTILEEMSIEHPAAKMIVEVAKTQEHEVGDGTTTAVVITGELLKNAEILLDKDIHPTIITKGFRLASERALEILKKMAERITLKDDDILRKIAITAMTGKGAESSKFKLANLAVEAVKQVIDSQEIDASSIKIEKKIGDGVEDSELIKGVVIDKERLHPSMPKQIRNARIALLDAALEIKNTEIEAKIQITSPDQLQSFLDKEEAMLKNMVQKVKNSGANVLVCQKGIDDVAQYYLATEGIYAVRRVGKEDMEKISRATGAKVVSNLNTLSPADIGSAGIVESKKVGNEEMTYIKECTNPKAVTLLVRGGTEHVIAEIERAIKDAVGDIIAALKNQMVVAGAGATETEVARGLREYANSLSGREQLAVLSFADAIEIIPRTLAENSGLDPIDVLTDLKSRHESSTGKWQGINVFTGKIVDAWDMGVIEPLKIKTQAIKSASEVAEMILRIDDIIAAGESPDKGMPKGGMGGGMPPDMGY
jgi:thermosome